MIFRGMARGLLTSCLMLLAACGGGGSSSGDTLNITFTYDASVGALLKPTRITPQTTGFEGRRPACQLVSGALPAGMKFNGDCSITGTPTEAGPFQFVVRVGASGVSNTLDINTGILVLGPSVEYLLPDSYSVGDTVDVTPLNSFWVAESGYTVTYSAAVGSLPPGFALDPTSGHITGQAARPGSYSFQIKADVASGSLHGTVKQSRTSVISVSFPVPPGYSPGSLDAWVARPFHQTPVLPAFAGGSYSLELTSITGPGLNLPAGMTFDPATGLLAGTPTEEVSRRDFVLKIDTIFEGNIVATTNTGLTLSVTNPDYIVYIGRCADVGPCDVLPIVNDNMRGSGGTVTYAFSGALPNGLTLDTVTGRISGNRLIFTNETTMILVTIRRDSFTYQLSVPFS